MSDIRLQRMAKVLVHYSLGIKKGDRLGIMTGPNATPLVREVVREAVTAGAYPEIFVELPGVREILLDAQKMYFLTKRWVELCISRSVLAFPKPVVSINQPCIGIWYVICVLEVKFALMENYSLKMENL